MSLLQKTIGDYKFSYQLPLNFDDQLKLIDKVVTFYSYVPVNKNGEEDLLPIMQFGKVWEFIKKDITILTKDDKTVWKGGQLQSKEHNLEMLCLSKQASQFFVSQFQVFLKGLGINLEA